MSRRIFVATLAAVSLLAANVVQAEMKGDAAAGEGKAAACIGCHGVGGNSEVATFPRLAGQYPAYIAKQIRDFKKAVRTNSDAMAGMAAMIATEQDAMDLGAFFSSQAMAAKPISDVDTNLVTRGEKIYIDGVPERNVYGCVNCHGARGKGKSNIPYFPVIGGQHRDYTIKQLTEFRSGGRANDPAGMMANVAKGLSDEEISALANYLSTQLP
jgi:cytochrome c553